MMDNVNLALNEFLNESPIRVVALPSSNNDVHRIETGDTIYILKSFRTERHRAYEREVGMRECLSRYSQIKFPEIIEYTEIGNERYVLMEHVSGKNLEEIWDLESVKAWEMKKLGEMLGLLHEIPVADAKHFLEREETLFSERYFKWMVEKILPFFGKKDLDLSLNKCYEVITNTKGKEVVIHADFGPHQVIVDKQGNWVLVDFEYAAIGVFVDDLAGAEVRLEQKEYPKINRFLEGYFSVQDSLAEYELLRNVYKAYNLLAMLTYGLSHREVKPPSREMNRLESILEEL